MPPSLPRKRFQVHLSTAIIQMFAAGGLIWANVVPTYTTKDIHFDYLAATVKLIQKSYGWPLIATKSFKVDNDVATNVGPARYDTFTAAAHMSVDPDGVSEYTSYYNIALNILIALLLLAITWSLCERWIAYRASRHTRST
ncbi:MAG TPA: hypothetical protein VKX17_26275 [Planctomycetota bacterium]|nr:hypothetical protein [Planctomycetota bacterium]